MHRKNYFLALVIAFADIFSLLHNHLLIDVKVIVASLVAFLLAASIFLNVHMWKMCPDTTYTCMPARWPNFLCVCSVFSSGSVQLHWSQWPPMQDVSPKWFSTSKGLLGAGPSGIIAADAIITESGSLHIVGVPIVNPSTVVVWEVIAGPGNGLQFSSKINVTHGIPPSMSPPCWTGFAPLASYLFSWQEHLNSEKKHAGKQSEHELNDVVSLHCSPVSNLSAYVSPEASAQSAAATTWGSGVTAVAFDPTRGGSVISVVIVEGLGFLQ